MLSLIVKEKPVNSSSECITVKSVELTYLNHLYSQLNGYICWKDINSVFLGCNKQTAKLAGISKPEHILGCNDDDFIWGQGGAANIFQQEDKLLLEQRTSILVLGRYKYGDEKIMLVVKKPLTNPSGQIIGTISQLSEIIDPHYGNIIKHLKSNNVKINQALQDNIINSFLKEDYAIPNLTKRELNCLYYLFKGMSAKVIAHTLKISQRTVETHIIHMREKFHVRKTSELLVKACQKGLVEYNPA